jgi:hypothetical protein
MSIREWFKPMPWSQALAIGAVTGLAVFAVIYYFS